MSKQFTITLPGHRSNLVLALRRAIESQQKYEIEALGCSQDSAMLAGWKEWLRQLESADF